MTAGVVRRESNPVIPTMQKHLDFCRGAFHYKGDRIWSRSGTEWGWRIGAQPKMTGNRQKSLKKYKWAKKHFYNPINRGHFLSPFGGLTVHLYAYRPPNEDFRSKSPYPLDAFEGSSSFFNLSYPLCCCGSVFHFFSCRRIFNAVFYPKTLKQQL